MKEKVFLGVFLAVILIGPCFAEDISNCTNLSSANTTYNLIQNIHSNETCFTIEADNITLDCQGYAITGNTSGYGINVTNHNDITIKNCIVMNFSKGIYLTNSSNNNLTNNTANNNNETGIYLYSSSNNTLIFNTMESNDYAGINLVSSSSNNTLIHSLVSNNGDGIYLESSSDNNTLTNNTITNSIGCGIYLNSSSNNNIYNNLFNNTNNFNITGTNQNYWNTTKQNGTRIYSIGTQIGGNYWAKPNGTGYSEICIKNNKDGFCGRPYDLINRTSCTKGVDCSNNTDYHPLTNNRAYLNLIPSWNNTYNYTGNKTLSVGETESESTTRNLFINLNQTRTLNFIINNSAGTTTLTNLSVKNSSLTDGSHTLNFTNIELSENISAGGIDYLNITIEPPENSSYLGNYSGWIYLNSSNGEPYTYLNLTLNITVTNQTLSRLNKTNKVYYFESNNLTKLNFSVYFFDNQTVDEFWNSSGYNLTLKNLTGAGIQNVSFNVSSGLFSGQINTTNLTEGNYTIFGNLNDTANNTAEVNLSFELVHNLNLNVMSNLDSVVKAYPFDFTVNISKFGNLNAENVSVCLELPTGIENTSFGVCNNSIGNINQTNSTLVTWQLNGTVKDTYTINITVSSEDRRFNKTIQQDVVVRYGVLTITWKTEPPSERDKDEEFYVKVYVNNTGDWNATDVLVDISFSSTYFTKLSGDALSCDDCEIISVGECCDDCSWELNPKTVGDNNEIEVSVSGNNTTFSPSDGSISKDVDINTPSSDGGDGGDGGDDPYYALSFEKPTSSSFEIQQGKNYDLKVEVKNIGDSKLNDLYLTLTGISSDYYSINPSTKNDLSLGDTKEFTMKFSIPADLEAKDYDLTLKAISDEKTKTKSITLTVKKVSLEFINLTNLNITQGEQLLKKFKIKNIGEVTLHNLFPNLSSFNITPLIKINLDKNKEKEYTINFSIPENGKIGVKELILKIISDERTFTRKFNLTILPCEEEKIKIKENYEDLKSEFESLTKTFKESKNRIENASAFESKLNNTNQTLSQMKAHLEKGEYLEANKLINKLKAELQELSTSLELKELKGIPIYLIVASILILSFVGFVFFYSFLPKQGYIPGKGYIAESRVKNIEDKIKNFFGKLLKPKSEEDILRRKKLEEWKRFYEEKKRKGYF